MKREFMVSMGEEYINKVMYLFSVSSDFASVEPPSPIMFLGVQVGTVHAVLYTGKTLVLRGEIDQSVRDQPGNQVKLKVEDAKLVVWVEENMPYKCSFCGDPSRSEHPSHACIKCESDAKKFAELGGLE